MIFPFGKHACTVFPLFRFRESQRPYPGVQVLRLQRPGPLLLEAGPGQCWEWHCEAEPDHWLLVRDLAAGQHSPAQVRSGSRYRRVTSGYSGPMRLSAPRAQWERNMGNVSTSGRHWPSSCFLKGVISCHESLQYRFDRMESDSDQSDEDTIPEIAKMAKKKFHRDLMFHMEM